MHVLCSIYKPNSVECKASDLFHFDCWLKYKVEFKTPLEVCLHTHIHASQHVALLEQKKRLMSVGLITKNKQFSCKSWTSKDRKPHSSLVSHNEYRNPPSPEDLHTFPYVVFASQFLCMPLMGNLEAALFSPTHTLRTIASGLFHEYHTHNKSLFMNY